MNISSYIPTNFDGYLKKGFNFIPQNKLIIVIALAALSLLASAYLIIRHLGKKASSTSAQNTIFTEKEIAEHLLLNSTVLVSKEMVEKVNKMTNYLKQEGLELKGVKANGNSFPLAFLESYKSLRTRKIPILDNLDKQKDKVTYLRDTISSAFSNTFEGNRSPSRIDQIKQSTEWLSSAEGGLLASALSIPMRIITVNYDCDGCGISDMLTFPEEGRDAEDWNQVEDSEKLKEYITIIDLGGHFVTALPTSSPIRR